MSRRVFVVCVLGAVTLGLARGSGPSVAAPGPATERTQVGCPTDRAQTVAIGSSSAPAGVGLWAAAAGRLVRVDGPSPSIAGSGAPGDVMVRHVVSVDGVGTAFVEDGPGADTVVLATEAGIVRLPQRGEAVHPALSPAGDLAWSVGSEIRVRDAGSGRIDRLPVPVGAQAFSPVFVEGGGLDAVLSSLPTGAVPEDERLNDVWHVSTDGAWRRVTSFSADDDRWTAIRTPVAAPEGGVDFVLVRGRGSVTREPRFLLMHLGRQGLERLRTLDHEMYLAGFDGPARLWNVPDIHAGRVDLVRENPDGTSVTIGCGTTLMDPIDVADPDRAFAPDGSPVPPPGDTAQAQPDPANSVAASDAEIGILVGDFASTEEADVAAAAVRAAYGSDAPVRVVASDTAPHAVRPGVYGVLLALSASEDPRSALAAFRAKLPAYASTSWVVTA